MLTFLPIVLSVTVSVFALLRGGRYGRLLGLFMVARRMLMRLSWFLWWPARPAHDSIYFGLQTLPEMLFFLAVLWLTWWYRARWLLAVLALQALEVWLHVLRLFPPDIGDRFAAPIYWVSVAISACIAWGLVRRRFGPPEPAPPAVGAALTNAVASRGGVC